MSQIEITEKGNNTPNILYVKLSVQELLERTGCVVKSCVVSERNALIIDCPDYYADMVKAEIQDRIAEVIAIKYKYDYFKKAIKIGGLSELEKEILLTSLISADLEEDKRYVYAKIKGEDTIAVDGTYNFRLIPLKKKWQDVVSYMPSCFLSSQLKDFVSFLLENKKKRVYVDNGKVYDEHYRRLNRCSLLDGDEIKVVREIILSNSREVEINGQLNSADEKYLKEYYGDKIYFSNKFCN